MQVQVKHNGTTITGFVESYEREHKICTGIGTLRVEIVRTINRTFDPWDSIDIYENGDFKVRYYISSVEDLIPRGVIVLECQDISKRLVDYFIPDTYTIDYPSRTRYWIEKFLTEAGIDFTFNTSSQGNLISNNTQLGLQPAYEQILTLLQMSGWFIYFNEAEEAVIGPLNADLAIAGRSVGKGDILEINRISDDKMLRNRALVIGSYNLLTMAYASADITVHTRWNYDHRDVRAVVISNSNIPTRGVAYGLANQIIKEFARITVEKHITLWGARDYNLGDAIRVNSTVWRGKGLITTFGTSMSKQGLITRIILDERCPRLFGFFDYGDYVYVGTYGDGVWKKHIKFDHTWHNFSSGLTNLNITDLHINNGVFGSVAASGEMYRTFEEGGWNQITISSFMSSSENTVASGQIVNYIPFSGLMGRAVIVDKITNTVKFGIDNYSGVNMGDYFLDHYGSGIVSSGLVVSSGITASGMRSWIAEYDPFTGQLVGQLGSGIYPVVYSGDYNFSVVDLENDGVNDYISVRGGVGTGDFVADGYDLGKREAVDVTNTFDNRTIIPAPINTVFSTVRTENYNPELQDGNPRAIAMYDDAFTGNRCIVTVDHTGEGFKTDFIYTGSSIDQDITFLQVLDTSDTVLAIHKLEEEDDDVYRIYYYSNWSLDKRIRYKDWNTTTNTVSSSVIVFTSSDTHEHVNGQFQAPVVDSISLNGFLYFSYQTFTSNGGNIGGGVHAPHELWAYIVKINMETGVVLSSPNIYYVITDEWSPGDYEYFADDPSHTTAPASGGMPIYCRFILLQDGDTAIKILAWLEYGHPSTSWKEHLLLGNENGITSDTEIYNSTPFRFAQSPAFTKTQLTKNHGLLCLSESVNATNLKFSTNGYTFSTYTTQAPYYLRPATIYPIFNRGEQYYCAINGANYFACDPLLLLPAEQINPPAGITLKHPYPNATTYGDEIFWFAQNSSFQDRLLKASSLLGTSGATIIEAEINGSTTSRGFNAGGFFGHGISTTSFTPITFFYFLGGELEFPSYLVLQREGSDFNLVQREAYPIRLDISNNSPLLTVGSGENSFVSNYVYGNELTQIIFTSGNPIRVEDYRYAYIEPTFSGITSSGLPVQAMGLYITQSGIMGADIATYSGGFQVLYEIPSGYGNRIETSNNGLGGQYVFVTTSGDNPMFFQKDPEEYSFTSRPGLPVSRATIIRLDDRL